MMQSGDENLQSPAHSFFYLLINQHLPFGPAGI
jgi:hypothetical protein